MCTIQCLWLMNVDVADIKVYGWITYFSVKFMISCWQFDVFGWDSNYKPYFKLSMTLKVIIKTCPWTIYIVGKCLALCNLDDNQH